MLEHFLESSLFELQNLKHQLSVTSEVFYIECLVGQVFFL